MYNLKNKVVLITGATGGFGRALTKRVLSKGAKVVLGDIAQGPGDAFAAECNKMTGGKCAVFRKCDVTDFKQIRALFDAGISEFGSVDVVVNNAGLSETKYLHDDEIGEWERVLRIDLSAVIEGTRLALHYIDPKRGGVVINVASMAGFLPLDTAPVYTGAKHGVVGFSLAMALTAKPRNIRVNCVAPSFAETNILKTESPTARKKQFENVVKSVGLVTVEQVIDAMILLIEDTKYNGDAAQITKARGITIHGKKTGAAARQETAKL